MADGSSARPMKSPDVRAELSEVGAKKNLHGQSADGDGQSGGGTSGPPPVKGSQDVREADLGDPSATEDSGAG